jgi:hypothetical protein
MHTITLNVNDNAYNNLMCFLSNKNDIKIIKDKIIDLDIEAINENDLDYMYILKGREERKKYPENYGELDDIDWD